MPYEHSAGAVIFRKENERPLYLLLHYEAGHWGCAKGHVENSETIEETARREITGGDRADGYSFCPRF